MRLLTVYFAASILALAQIGTSTITGRVTDASGAVVPNVNVTVVQKSTNITSTAVTNSEGIYRVPSLQPGEYRVTFESTGFKTRSPRKRRTKNGRHTRRRYLDAGRANDRIDSG